MKIVKLYELRDSDGYTDRGTGEFYETSSGAIAATEDKIKLGGWMSSPKTHDAIENPDGGYFLLVSTTPVYTVGSPELEKLKKKRALEKLTKEERDLFGLE